VLAGAACLETPASRLPPQLIVAPLGIKHPEQAKSRSLRSGSQPSGPQTTRVQTREDGFRFDPIVLSSGQFLTAAPGALENGATILPRVH
jgi:hypothetical protein